MANTRRKSYKKSGTRGLVGKIFKTLFVTGFCGVAFLCIYSATVISHAPAIDTTDIYSYLSQSSILYDDKGNIIDNVFVDGGNRVNLSYEEMPENMVNAIVSIEDKTFWNHNGFNIIRIFGAIWDSITGGGDISGTSTITQQLARNVYLSDIKSERSLNRKVTEAWYTVLLEQNMTKEQIVEAYLNTIYLGYNCYGIEAASRNYFNKNAKDLDLVECVALAAIPANPDNNAPLRTYSTADFAAVAADIPENYVLRKRNDWVVVYNGDVSKDRRDTTLNFMEEQGYITAEEHQAAVEDDLSKHMKLPSEKKTANDYFIQFALEEVLEDLVEAGYTEKDARTLLYTGGLRIYTTLNQKAQDAVAYQFENSSSFPYISYYANYRDEDGNIYERNGETIMLYDRSSYLPDGVFTFGSDELQKNEDGSVTLLRGKRLNFYDTAVDGGSDISVEFKPMYQTKDSILYVVESSAVLIPATYKSYDDNKNVVISAQFFTDYPNVLVAKDDTYQIGKDGYTLGQPVKQPQAAMVICDNKTGAVKAMVGGRGIRGEAMYNRATNPRQTGSSIKPLSVYSSALQQGAEALQKGQTLSWTKNDPNDNTKYYGSYWTAASRINDARMVVNGRQWPKNAYAGFQGLMSMRKAIEVSCNVAAVRVYLQVGPEYITKQLKKYGVTSLVEKGDTNDMNSAALALGGQTNGISPLEMASAYTTFPAGGIHRDYSVYTTITNSNDEVILKCEPKQTRVLDNSVAWIMLDMLHSTVTRGIATLAQCPNQPTAGKTGTTSDQYDIWFCGCTPQYSAALWMGSDYNLDLGTSSDTAASLWRDAMTNATEGLTGDFPAQPDDVVLFAGEYFVKGTEGYAYFPPVKKKEDDKDKDKDKEKTEDSGGDDE